MEAAALEMLRARRAGQSADVAAVLQHGARDAAKIADAAMSLALAGVDDDAVFRALGALLDAAPAIKDKAARAAARARCGVADLPLARSTWRRLGGARLRPWDAPALRALWAYSKSRKKVASSGAAPRAAWPPAFADWSLPLVVDVGCGFAASPAALAARTRRVNVLACDRAAHALLYGRSLATRLRLADRCQIVRASAEDALHWVRERYAGPVESVLFQFPTPPALPEGRNAQLPSAPSKYMASPRMIDLARRAGTPGRTTILVASNVEDVAVAARDVFDATAGLRVLQAAEALGPKCAAGAPEAALNERARRWVAAGGKRAAGPDFLPRSPLVVGTRVVRTETEGEYESAGKPVHRVAAVVVTSGNAMSFQRATRDDDGDYEKLVARIRGPKRQRT